MRSHRVLGPLALIAFGLFSLVVVLEVITENPPRLRFWRHAKPTGSGAKLRFVSSRELTERRRRQKHPW